MKAQRKKNEVKRSEFRMKNQKNKNWSPENENEKKIISQVKDLTEPLCEAEGIELVHVEYQRERGGRTLRLYIDRPGGVSLDDCVNISRQASDILDANLESGHERKWSYNIEVSSPGPNRPLGKKLDFERFKGRMAQIKIAPPVNGQKTHKNKTVKGILLGISEDIVKLAADDKIVAIPFKEITRAHLVN